MADTGNRRHSMAQAGRVRARFEVEMSPDELAEVERAVGSSRRGSNKRWLLSAARAQDGSGALLREIAGLTAALASVRVSFGDVAAVLEELVDELRRRPDGADVLKRAGAVLETSDRSLGAHEISLGEASDRLRATVARLVLGLGAE